MTKAYIRTRFNELLGRKEDAEGRQYSYTDIIEATGLHRQTVANYRLGRVDRYDENTLIKLCAFLDCEIGDLLEIVPAAVNGSGAKEKA